MAKSTSDCSRYIYHAVAAALELPAPRGALAIAAGADKGKPNSKAEGPRTEGSEFRSHSAEKDNETGDGWTGTGTGSRPVPKPTVPAGRSEGKTVPA